QSKLVKYFSRQLSCKRKVALQERNAKLEGFPQLLHWFRIVDIRKEVMEEIAPGQLSLEELLDMTDDQVCATVEKFGANSEECARLNASLSCLRSVHKSGDLSKQDWTIQWPSTEPGKENSPGCPPEPAPWGRTHLSPKVQPKCGQHHCHSGSPHGPMYTHVDRLTVESHPGLCPPLESGHRSLPPSPRQRHAAHTPPRTPNIVTTMTPPGTPPVRRRNKLKPPGTPPPSSRKLIHLIPGFTALHRSKSHEFQLGHRVDEAHTPKKKKKKKEKNVLHNHLPSPPWPGDSFWELGSKWGSKSRVGGHPGLDFPVWIPGIRADFPTHPKTSALAWEESRNNEECPGIHGLLLPDPSAPCKALGFGSEELSWSCQDLALSKDQVPGLWPQSWPWWPRLCRARRFGDPQPGAEGGKGASLRWEAALGNANSFGKSCGAPGVSQDEGGKRRGDPHVAVTHPPPSPPFALCTWGWHPPALPSAAPLFPLLPRVPQDHIPVPYQPDSSSNPSSTTSSTPSSPAPPLPPSATPPSPLHPSPQCQRQQKQFNLPGAEEVQESEDDFEEMNLSLLSARNFPRKASQTSIFLQEWDIPFEQLEIGELIGKGRFGQVFHGRWHGEVAIRLIDIERDNEDQLKAFKREVMAYRQTRHENVVLFMGACMSPPHLAIITRFVTLFFLFPSSCPSSLCKGRTLYSVVRDAKIVLDVNKTRQIAQEIVKGMGYLHAKGILHKDLKSKNVFYDNGKVVITDFGLFSISGVLQAGRRENKLRIQNGWLCHLAPEIIRQLSPDTEEDKLPFSKHSDVFALGTIWYELHAREWPFKTQPAEAIIWQVGRGMKPNLSQIGMGKEISDILLFCWAYEQEERPTFTKLMDMLEKLPKRNRRLSHPGHFWKSAE
ncbi:KSR2 Kinase, partial [Chaetops frenatus]|nr:KSR2 Kinase [Chaetops frenatus]